MMIATTGYLSLTIAVIGLVQAAFLCLLLRSEGARAFCANRWMMLFIAAVALNLVEDIFDVVASPAVNFFSILLFSTANFVIAPAIYLYFREISGRPVRRVWPHFLILPVMANLILWILVDGGVQGLIVADLDELAGATGHEVSLILGRVVTIGHFAQCGVYVAQIWCLARAYLRKTEQQLGAERRAMRVWVASVLGGMVFLYGCFALSKILSNFYPKDQSILLVQLAFVLVFLGLSYVFATRPVLFVMADWPADIEGEEDDRFYPPRGYLTSGSASSESPMRPAAAVSALRSVRLVSSPDMRPGNDGPQIGIASPAMQDLAADPGGSDPVAPETGHAMAGYDGPGIDVPCPSAPSGAPAPVAGTGDDAHGIALMDGMETAMRPLLDEDGVAQVCRRLAEIRRAGDMLFDPLVSLPRLARAVGVSPNQLSYVLNHHVGQNFFDFVNAARIEEARAVLLDDAGRTILDVALSVGFNSKSTFNLAFRKFTGMTPTELRRIAQQADAKSDAKSNTSGAMPPAPAKPQAEPRAEPPANDTPHPDIAMGGGGPAKGALA